MKRRAVYAAGLLLAASCVRLSMADVRLDALRNGDGLSAPSCPARVASVAAELAASAPGARRVFAEFIDGRKRGTDALDLDLTGGGHAERAFRMVFPPDPEPAQFLLALFMNDGSARVACRVRLPPRRAELVLEIPLRRFRRALGVPDYSDVDYILLVMHREGAASNRRGQVTSLEVGPGRWQGALTARCR